MADPMQEPFQGVDFSASGLRQVALQFRRYVPKLGISGLISAPNLEHLELEFPSAVDGEHLELSLCVAPRRHDKPFRLTLVTYYIHETSSRNLLLDLRCLEQGFGPQDYANWESVGAALHQPLLKPTSEKHKRIYCNQAYTAAARAQSSRLAAALQTCNFELFREDWLCEKCELKKDQEIGRGTW